MRAPDIDQLCFPSPCLNCNGGKENRQSGNIWFDILEKTKVVLMVMFRSEARCELDFDQTLNTVRRQ